MKKNKIISDLENSKIDLFLTVHTLEKTNGLFDRREEIGEEKAQVAELALSVGNLMKKIFFLQKLKFPNFLIIISNNVQRKIFLLFKGNFQVTVFS